MLGRSGRICKADFLTVPVPDEVGDRISKAIKTLGESYKGSKLATLRVAHAGVVADRLRKGELKIVTVRKIVENEDSWED